MTRKILVLVSILLAMTVLVACGGKPTCPDGQVLMGDQCVEMPLPGTPGPGIPSPEPTPCQQPNDWVKVRGFTLLKNQQGQTVGSIQLYVDERNGVILIDGHKPEVFPPCEKKEETVAGISIQVFIDNSTAIWLSPQTMEWVATPTP